MKIVRLMYENFLSRGSSKDLFISFGIGLALSILVRLTVFNEDCNLLVMFFTVVTLTALVFGTLKLARAARIL